MNVLDWFSSGAASTGWPYDGLWAWVTFTLSALIVVGYAMIAIGWYFQSKVPARDESRVTLRRLRAICLACAAAAYALYTIEIPWHVWRAYDVGLFALAAYTWWSVLRTRGWSLVDRRLAQVDELESTAARYREIAELLPHVVWTSSTDGTIDFSNHRWREYAGAGRTWLEAVHPDEEPLVRAAWDQAVARRQPMSVEARLGDAGGAYRTFLVKAAPVVHGEEVKWLGACADIEDQHLLAVEKERQARQRAFFLNALSHDLRAPLHNVLLNAQLLKMSVEDADGAESVEMIVENAVAAGDLVTRLLDFAKVGAQDQNEIETVSVAATLQQIARRFQPVAEQKGLALQVGRAGAPEARVLTDRQKLERIVSNLLDNAIKYTQRGGVTLEWVEHEDEVVVRITDTGIGVPPQDVPYLFDEFYQVSNYERDRSKGFGMGLAICRSLARHIGGDVRLARTGPDGSCFELLVRNVGAHRGGRPGGSPGDHADPAETGVCRV